MKSPFRQSHAAVIGIDRYRDGIPRLTTARRDAEEIARVLGEAHGYRVSLLTEDATRERILELLGDRLPRQLGSDDRLLFYFAGHGVARDSEKGLSGFLVPEDASPGPSYRDILLDMDLLKEHLAALPCHHLLVVLDCCFAGAFRWSMTREAGIFPDVIHRELYERFVHDPAWQVLTSAAHDQQANDVLWGLGERGVEDGHSPFARALFEGLAGAADLVPPGGDGLITTTELFLYLRDQVERKTEAEGRRQTPGLWSLKEQDKGEYVFEVPEQDMNLPPAPPLDEATNPYRGLEPFEEKHQELFFGRERILGRLLETLSAHPLTVLAGASGTGKSSLVQAGLLPALRGQEAPRWTVLGPVRPGERPLQALADAVAQAGIGLERLRAADGLESAFHRRQKALLHLLDRRLRRDDGLHLLLFVDQFEELVTACPSEIEAQVFQELLAGALAAHPERLRLVLAVRSDYEASFKQSPLVAGWKTGRLVVPPMTHDELRRAILGPASQRVLFFEPEDLIDELVEEVLRMPGALPLLSFTLRELYLSYLASGRTDRTLTRRDYEGLGGVSGAVSNRAEEECRKLGDEHGPTILTTLRRVMLRMVDLQSGEPTRRRVPRQELSYPSEAEHGRVEEVLERFLGARLIVSGQDADGRSYVEPAHDKLIGVWERLRRWIAEERQTLLLLRRLTQVSGEWALAAENPKLLWDREPRVGEIRELREGQPEVLNAQETRFVRAAIDQHKRNLWKRRFYVGATIAGLAVAATVFLLQRDQARSQRDLSRAQSLTSRAVTIQRESKEDEIASLIALRAYQLNVRSGRPLMSEVDEALRAVLREPFYSYVMRDRPHTFRGIAFSPDGRYLAADGEETRLRIWPVADPREPPLDLAPSPRLLGLAYVQDGSAVLTVGKELHLWKLDAGRANPSPLVLDSAEGLFMDIAMNPREPISALISTEGAIHLWDLRDPDRGPTKLDSGMRPFELGRDQPYSLHVAWHPEGEKVFATDYDGRVYSWSLATQSPAPQILTQHQGPVYDLAASPDGTLLASAGWRGFLRLSSLDSEKTIDIPAEGENEGWRAVVFSPDGRQLAAAGDDDHVYLWTVAALRSGDFSPNAVLDGHERGVYALAYRPDGRMLASAGAGGEIRLWDLVPTKQVVLDLPRQPSKVTQIRLCGPSGLLASGRADGALQLWRLDSGDLLDNVDRAHGDEEVRGLVFDPACQVLASGGDDRMLHLWSLADDRLTLLGSARDEGCRALKAIAISPDGKDVAVGCESGPVKIWNVRRPDSPVLRFEAPGHSDSVPEELIRAVAFRPDGKILASGSGDSVIKLWNMEELSAAPVILRHSEAPTPEDRIYALAYSPDGATLAVGYFGGAIRLWRDGSPSPILLPGHEALVWSLAFTPDGKQLVSGGRDDDLRIWDLEEPTSPALAMRQHEDEVRAVAVDPSGKYVVSAGEDGRIVRSVLRTKNLAAVVCEKVRRDISREEWKLFVGGWADSFYERVCPGLPICAVTEISEQ